MRKARGLYSPNCAERLSDKSPKGVSILRLEGPTWPNTASLLRFCRPAATSLGPILIYQTVSEGGFSEVRIEYLRLASLVVISTLGGKRVIYNRRREACRRKRTRPWCAA